MIRNFTPTAYKISSRRCSFDDDGLLLDDAAADDAALLRTDYRITQLRLHSEAGLYRYADWLPVRHRLSGATSPVVWRSRRLAHTLGLDALYIIFNGWFPRRGAVMSTCSFKEAEAYAVCSRYRSSDRVLVVASAGNTARAFAKVCSDNRIPLLLCVPEDNIGALWFERPVDKCVRLIAPPSGSDYYDAIALSRAFDSSPRFVAEGGAKNVARRDGMATSFLAATIEAGRIPDCYFQAVGSGTGAIAAWEANQRLVADGRFGQTTTRLMLSQNLPFVPIVDAWRARKRKIDEFHPTHSRHLSAQIEAKVLANSHPPYEVKGGLFDALSATQGEVYAVSNDEIREAQYLFHAQEGVDIVPAAAVAVASLSKAVEGGDVKSSQTIALNITGGGEVKFKTSRKLHYLKPDYVFAPDADPTEIVSQVEKLY